MVLVKTSEFLSGVLLNIAVFLSHLFLQHVSLVKSLSPVICWDCFLFVF